MIPALGTPDSDRAVSIQPARKPARPWMWAVKVVVTAALLTWVLRQVSWTEFWQTLGQASIWLILAVAVLRFGTISLSAFKWQQLLAVHGAHYGFNKLQGWYFISLFLSQLLPSLIGGDAYRVYKTYHNARARVVSVLAVLVDRGTGLIALLALGYAAAIYVHLDTGDELARAIVWIGTAFFAALPIGLWLVFSHHRERFTRSRFCPKPLRSLIQHADDYRSAAARRRMALVWAASFAFHAVRIGTTWLLLYSIGVFSDVGQVAVAVVAVNVAGMLPISLGGVGLMEGSFVLVMGRYGVTAEAGLITMLLSRAMLVPMFVAAGVYFLLERREEAAGEPPRRAAQPELGEQSIARNAGVSG